MLRVLGGSWKGPGFASMVAMFLPWKKLAAQSMQRFSWHGFRVRV